MIYTQKHMRKMLKKYCAYKERMCGRRGCVSMKCNTDGMKPTSANDGGGGCCCCSVLETPSLLLGLEWESEAES